MLTLWVKAAELSATRQSLHPCNLCNPWFLLSPFLGLAIAHRFRVGWGRCQNIQEGLLYIRFPNEARPRNLGVEF